MASDVKMQVQEWWNTYPMDYKVQAQPGTREFFEAVDRRMYDLHPFFQDRYPIGSKLINYPKYRGKRVLEIGCGMGTMAQQFAEQGARYSAIDLTQTAVQLTKRRFKLFGLEGDIQQGDAEALPFGDESFDLVFSWGVLFLAPDVQRAVNEVYRVLKKGGKVLAMFYHRGSLHFFYLMWLEGGIINLDRHFLSKRELDSRYTDGIERGLPGNPYCPVHTRKEAMSFFAKFKNVSSNLYSLAAIRSVLPRDARFVPKFLIRHYERRLGFFNVITAQK